MASGGSTSTKLRRLPLRAAGVLERAVLGGLMTAAVIVIERRLIKAIQKGDSRAGQAPSSDGS
jgi:hypothetical protein